MNKKIIPFWTDLIQALANDHHQECTWKELINQYFVNDTDIAQLYYETMNLLDINIDEVVNKDKVNINKFITEYTIEIIDKNFFLKILNIQNTIFLKDPKDIKEIEKKLNQQGYRFIRKIQKTDEILSKI